MKHIIVFWGYLFAFIPLAIADTSTNIKIGAIVPLSGPIADVGEAVKNSMLIADEKYDLENRVSFVFEDDGYIPKNTVTAYRKLVSLDEVKAIFVFGSPTSLAIADQAEQAKLPMISIAMMDSLTKGKKHVVRYNISAASIDAVVKKEIKKRKYESVAILTTENDGQLDVHSHFLHNTPVQVVYDRRFLPDERDFRSSAAKIAELNPSAVYILLMPPASATFSKQLRSLGYKGELFGSPLLGTRQELEASSGALIGAWYVLFRLCWKRTYLIIDNLLIRLSQLIKRRQGDTPWSPFFEPWLLQVLRPGL